MANINDFKLVGLYSKKYFEYLEKTMTIRKNFTEIDKKRNGFYIFILELITGNRNLDELQSSIIDTEYCRTIFGEENNDYGIDAVYIDDDKKEISLFNFKFRENFKVNNKRKEKTILDSSKFMIELENNEVDKLTSISKNKIEEIIDRLYSDEIWEMKLYLVSNENRGITENNHTLESYGKKFDMKIKSVNLDEIISYISKKPDDISCKFIIDSDSVLTYEESSLSSSKSYLVKLSAANLIRITSNIGDLKDNYNLEDYEKLKKCNLNMGVLYDNVRGYLGESKFNKNIVKTLNDDPSKFFMYNNGITMTAKNIVAEEKNGKKKLLFKIEGMQIVNGGQTIRSIYKYKSEKFDVEKLANAEVLVRIFQTQYDDKLTNNIAEYTNSQNAISPADLKSISNLQIKIENYLKQNEIDYIRKTGDVGNDVTNYKYRISKERVAQIIYSYNGFPDRATNQKSKLFDRYYDEIFDEETLDFDLITMLIKLYFEIEEKYKQLSYKVYPQKIFYSIYLFGENDNIENNINSIEEALKSYRKDEDLSEARKLIQKGFKEKLDKNINK